jgi:hypothetical protein
LVKIRENFFIVRFYEVELLLWPLLEMSELSGVINFDQRLIWR